MIRGIDNLFLKEKKITRYFRKANWCWKHHIPVLSGLIMRVCRVIYSIDLPYTCEIGKNVVFIANFKPRKMMGLESNGMILSAEHDGKLVVTSTLDDIQSGACIV